MTNAVILTQIVTSLVTNEPHSIGMLWTRSGVTTNQVRYVYEVKSLEIISSHERLVLEVESLPAEVSIHAMLGWTQTNRLELSRTKVDTLVPVVVTNWVTSNFIPGASTVVVTNRFPSSYSNVVTIGN